MGLGLGELGCCGSRRPTLADMTGNHMMAAKKRAEGSCGWCLEFTQHTFYDAGNNVLGRVGWSCDNCKGRTAPAEGTDFARSTPHGGKDNIHPDKALAAKTLTKKRRVFSEEITENTVRRYLCMKSDSYYAALSLGMIRPFLLLASMSPASRTQIAILLGWPLMETAHFGQPHLEAADILTRRRVGLAARVKELHGPKWLHLALAPVQKAPTDWYQLLYRLSSELFLYMEAAPLGTARSKELCLQANNAALDIIECQLVDKLAVYLRHTFGEEQAAAIARLHKSSVLSSTLDAMQDMGVNREGMGQFIVDLCFLSLAKRDGSDFSAPVEAEEIVAEMEVLFGHFLAERPPLFKSNIESLNPKYISVFDAPDNSILKASFDPIWLAMEVLRVPLRSRVGQLLPIVLHLLLHKTRLALHGITLDQFVQTVLGDTTRKKPECFDDLRQRLPPGLSG